MSDQFKGLNWGAADRILRTHFSLGTELSVPDGACISLRQPMQAAIRQQASGQPGAFDPWPQKPIAAGA